MIGSSRKSFIGITLNKKEHDREWGTAATVTASIANGAHIVRVHDVKHMCDITRMTDGIVNERVMTNA